MKKNKETDKHIRKFTLDQPILYQVKIAGQPGENWSEWIDQVDIESETNSSGATVTTLTGRFDQAAIQGLLRRLYYLGYPLISVNYVELNVDKCA